MFSTDRKTDSIPFPDHAFEIDGVVVELLLDERTQKCEVPDHLRARMRVPLDGSTRAVAHVACSVTADVRTHQGRVPRPEIALRKVMPSRYVASACVPPNPANLGDFVVELVKVVRSDARRAQ